MIKSKSTNQNIAVADQEFPRRGRRSDPKDESARGGGMSALVHAGIHPLWAWAWTPPGVGLDTHPNTPPGCGPGHPLVSVWTPQPDPPTSPLGLGLDTPLARPPNLPLGLGQDTPPPLDRMTDRCKNITFANFV